MSKIFSLVLMLVMITGFSVYQSVADAAENVAYWECYFCHKTATTTPDNPSAKTPRAHFPFTNEGCPNFYNGHGWVWKGGVLPQETNHIVYICSYCHTTCEMPKNGGTPKNFPCPRNNKNPHNWIETGIVNYLYE
jgi:hypothetical protein